MKSLKFLSLWVIPLLFAWWDQMTNIQYANSDVACPLVCIDTVNVRLDNQCEVRLLPDMVLNAVDISCSENLQVEVFDPQNRTLNNRIPSEYAGLILKYVVTDRSDGNSCWGHVRVEDKSPPALVCPKPTDFVVNTVYTNILEGTLSNTDPAFERSNFTCWLSSQTPDPGPFYVDTIPFQVAKDGVYTFVLLSNFEAAGAIFQGSFSTDYPCQNIISFTESGNRIANRQALGDYLSELPIFQQQHPWVAGTFQPFIRIELALKQNQTYYLATTSLKTKATGNYAWLVARDEITQPPNTEILKGKKVDPLPWISELVCDDFDKIKLNGFQCYKTDADGKVLEISPSLKKILQLTGYPHNGSPRFTRGGSVSDNCGGITVCVNDIVQLPSGSCDPTVIKRTFTATDKVGNVNSCMQIITIRKPTILEVILPNYATYIECDEEFPVDSTGYPSPSVTGYPFVKTASGLRDLKQPFCNLAATYTNKARVEICDNAYTFLREWVIYDWCNPGNAFIYNQLIKVGDFTPPTVGNLPKDPWDCVPTFSTGIFSCVAAIVIPKPDTIFDNCSGWKVTVDVMIGTSEQVFVGNKKVGDVVTDIPRGLHRFRYRVEDDCHNKAIKDYWFEVLDLYAPVANCNDFLNVSLSAQNAGGTTRIFAKDVEEGSYDDCGIVGLKSRRTFEEPACADIYSQLFFGKAFTSLFLKKDANLSPYGLYYFTKVDTYFTENPDLSATAQPVFTLENGIIYSILKEYVDALCCDVNDSIRVELWVFDDANENGIPGDTVQNYNNCKRTLLDNYNKCWLDILIEDKAKPACKPPLDTVILCTDPSIRYQSTFTCSNGAFLDTIFGVFIPVDNCGAQIVCDTVIDKRDNCGVGDIIRVYYAIDGSGNRSEPCQQRITVLRAHNYEIKFPADIAGQCGVIRDTVIEVNTLACDLLAISVVDERLSTGGDECFKIQRTFHVINWCEYDGLSDPIVISRDEDCDGRPGDEAVYVLRRPGAKNAQSTFIDRNNIETDKIPAAGTKAKFCDGTTNPAGYWRDTISVGYWKYTQVIKAYDSIPPVLFVSPISTFCSEVATCSADIGIPFLVDEDCTREDISFVVVIDYNNDSIGQVVTQREKIRGQYPKFRYEDNYPFGEHSIEIRVRDACGNTTSERVVFTVEDCKAPTPVCINGLAAELMPVIPAADVNGDSIADNGAVTIWAEDFVASAISDCTGPIIYSIHRTGEVPNINQKSITFTCDDAGSTVPIAIYAWDNAKNPRSIQPDGTRGGRNYAYCITYILIQDNIGNCNGASNRVALTGKIATETDRPVEGVTVVLDNEQSQVAQTSTQGIYAALLNTDYGSRTLEVIPSLNRNYSEGVTTYDIVLISKHILGVQLLNSPYKLIAADVNNSQSITTLDVIQLRKLILSIDLNFPKNSSWRFVDKKYQFPVPANPWYEAFPEILRYDLNNFASKSDADFMAVKIGDVNQPSPQNNARGAELSVFEIQTPDQILQPDQTVRVPFIADLTDKAGYQFTLHFNPDVLELQDVEYGIATAENFGLHLLEQGILTTSWNVENNQIVTGSQQLFTLVFKSKAMGNLQDYLTLQSRPTLAESYDNQGVKTNIELSFSTNLTFEKPFTLYQNKPNPFRDETIIGFHLAKATNVKLTIYSVEGRLMQTTESNYSTGYQEFRVKSNELSGTGLYFYVLEVEGWKAVRKMLLD